MFEKIFLGVFNFAKKIYFCVFNFMIGTEERKFFRFFVHMMTILVLLLYPFVYFFSVVYPLLAGGAEQSAESLRFAIMAMLAPAILVFLIKIMMIFHKKS